MVTRKCLPLLLAVLLCGCSRDRDTPSEPSNNAASPEPAPQDWPTITDSTEPTPVADAPRLLPQFDVRPDSADTEEYIILGTPVRFLRQPPLYDLDTLRFWEKVNPPPPPPIISFQSSRDDTPYPRCKGVRLKLSVMDGITATKLNYAQIMFDDFAPMSVKMEAIVWDFCCGIQSVAQVIRAGIILWEGIRVAASSACPARGRCYQ